MRFYLTDQKHSFKKHLDYLKVKKVMDYDKSRLTENSTAIRIETTNEFEQLNLGFLFKYQIFPNNILTYKAQWSDEQRKMNVGDTIAQQVCIPPIKSFSRKMPTKPCRTKRLLYDMAKKRTRPTYCTANTLPLIVRT